MIDGKRRPLVYTPKATRNAAAVIVAAWAVAGSPRVPAGVPFECEIVARWERPASHLKADGSLGKRGLEMPYPRKPDVDNVLKLVLDALQPQCISDDDRCHAATIRKEYAEKEGLTITLRW